MHERLTPLFVAPLAVLALAACSDRSEPATEAGSATPSASAARAGAQHPRPGLWENVFTGGPTGATTLKVCVGDPEPDENPFAAPGQDADCGTPDIRDVPGGLSFEGTCRTEGMTIASRGTVTGDLRSAYRVDVTVNYSGAGLPPGMPAEMTMQVNARRLGDCPAGVEPGAIVP